MVVHQTLTVSCKRNSSDPIYSLAHYNLVRQFQAKSICRPMDSFNLQSCTPACCYVYAVLYHLEAITESPLSWLRWDLHSKKIFAPPHPNEYMLGVSPRTMLEQIAHKLDEDWLEEWVICMFLQNVITEDFCKRHWYNHAVNMF